MAISRLEPEFREAIVLREMEGMSYKEIAAVLKIPMGTVMSRLSRARNLLLADLANANFSGKQPRAAGGVQSKGGSA
jgi:RNA polymerase sigma-70 factor (ECF subfamily)